MYELYYTFTALSFNFLLTTRIHCRNAGVSLACSWVIFFTCTARQFCTTREHIYYFSFYYLGLFIYILLFTVYFVFGQFGSVFVCFIIFYVHTSVVTFFYVAAAVSIDYNIFSCQSDSKFITCKALFFLINTIISRYLNI